MSNFVYYTAEESMVFPSRLRQLKDERGLTLEELAKKTYLSELSMAKILNGERMPKFPYVHNLAMVLQTNIDYLLGRTDDKGWRKIEMG